MQTIKLASNNVTAEVVPERGAIVTSLRVGQTELLYLDRATLEDPTKNVRGGIPVLFPFAGKLADDTLVLTGTKMKQHGFGRNRAWAVTRHDPARLQMTLAADDDTRAQYPYAFTAHQTVTLVERGLMIELQVIASDQPLPISPGWHPYFAIAAAEKANVRGDLAGLSAHAFSDDREFDFGLPAPATGQATFILPGLGELQLSIASDRLRHVQFWSQPGKPFICIEPFWGPAGTINTEQRGWVPANDSIAFAVRIQLR